MTTEVEYKELFSNYAAEAGRYLPPWKRKDIQLEILSLLEDSIEGRSEEAGRSPDEEMAIEVLKELGPPITYAENYRPRNALIGPSTYPAFRLALIFTAGIFLLQFVIGLFVGGAGPGFLDVLDSLFDRAFQAFGVLVFVFFLLERFLPENWALWPFHEMARTWDPATLKSDRKKRSTNPGERWVESFFLVGAIVLLAAFPQWVGYGFNREGVWYFIPVLSESFSVYLPWVLAYFGVQMGYNIVLARQPYWDSTMRLASVGIRVLKIGLVIFFLTGPDVFGLNPAYLAHHSPTQEMVDWYTSTLTIWNTVFQVWLWIKLVTESLAGTWSLVKFARSRPAPDLSEVG